MKKNKNILILSQNRVRSSCFFAVDGSFFKAIKIFYFIALIYAVVMCVTVMLGNIVLMDEYSAKITTDMVAIYNEQAMYFVTMVVLLVVMAVCLVLLKLRLAIPFAIVGCINCVVAFTMFYGVSVENDIKNGGQGNFWMLFGVPSILLALLSLGLGALMLIDDIKVKKEYDIITSKLYAISTENGSKNLSNEEFDEIMDKYSGEELFRTDAPLKKSQRRRKEKQEKQQNE